MQEANAKAKSEWSPEPYGNIDVEATKYAKEAWLYSAKLLLKDTLVYKLLDGPNGTEIRTKYPFMETMAQIKW
jgi:hypothetical protein